GPAESFDAVWQAIRASLLPGGYFVGQLFGPNHYKGMNHIVRRTRSEVEAMLAGMEVIHLEELSLEQTHEGETVYYNYFEIIACNRKQ
ncbi:MAG: SAM-dependent methyltransferase, partial [Cyanobacteriota bacterium erpe_2018_sw_21hr_WHONDRS-SW48-000092_B_bin.40]|nr:SAM-dependent methyltransferase [Cyanobacteriota bacterium erpe_2018_sw_21hr_WHONDRS-SW48-000092_B_bin.40]